MEQTSHDFPSLFFLCALCVLCGKKGFNLMTKYRTKQGDMVDAICYKFYGRESAAVDVLKANPGLAGQGSVLPSGIIIDLPPLATPATPSKAVRLWD